MIEGQSRPPYLACFLTEENSIRIAVNQGVFKLDPPKLDEFIVNTLCLTIDAITDRIEEEKGLTKLESLSIIEQSLKDFFREKQREARPMIPFPTRETKKEKK